MTGVLPRVLLLSRTPPGHAGVGGVFLDELWDAYPPDRMAGFVVARSRWHLPEPGRARLAGVRAPSSRNTARWGPLGSLAGWFVRRFLEQPAVRRILERGVGFGAEHGSQVLWAVFNDPLVIRLAPRLAQRLGVPLRPLVWDPPEALATKLGLDSKSQRALLDDFAIALESVERCGVASEPMGELYRDRFDVEPVVLIHGVPGELRRAPAETPRTPDELILGFAGSLYAEAEWRALAAALNSVGWTVAGRDVRVRVLSHGAGFLDELGDRVERLDWRSLPEVIDLLADTTDAAYLPYWLDPLHDVSVRLCFPNKLTTYLAAGRPVLFHGPAGSSPDRFFDRYPVGPRCHSHDAGEILGALATLADPEAYRAAARTAARAAAEELSPEVFHRRFRRLVEIAP